MGVVALFGRRRGVEHLRQRRSADLRDLGELALRDADGDHLAQQRRELVRQLERPGAGRLALGAQRADLLQRRVRAGVELSLVRHARIVASGASRVPSGWLLYGVKCARAVREPKLPALWLLYDIKCARAVRGRDFLRCGCSTTSTAPAR